jgi:ABC-type transport system involved in cytochrome bd biosynthesis fused ATPase/permease subunit
MNNITDHRNHEVRVLTGVIAVICAIACATSVVPGLEDLINRALIVVAALGVLAVLVRLGARWVRERREDREDELAAAIWRAEHAASHVALPGALDRPAAAPSVAARRLRVVDPDERVA